MDYFSGLSTVAEIKKEYRRLALLNHPDIGGDTRTMQIINEQYHNVLKSCDGQTSIGSDKKQHTYRYNYDIEQELVDKIRELLALQMNDVYIELIGTWVWITGSTKQYKEKLKELKCQWHSKRGAWYFRRFTYRRRYSNKSFEELRYMYGTQDARDFEETSLVVA